ncbi:MAG: hypothetical protein LBD29_01200 [Treponema sp.]|jgi:hypothetical protein|nr:hypothetical protein [Treponema sp.]
MKKLFFILAGCVLLAEGVVFAQDSMTDDEYVNVTAVKKSSMDVYFGFRLGLTKNLNPKEDEGQNGSLNISPGVAVGYSYWLQDITNQLSLGPVIRASIGFINEFEWNGDTFTWSDGGVLLNIDGLFGYGMKFQIIDLLGITAKAGIAINADTINYSASSITWRGQIVDYSLTFAAVMVGLGLDVGIQISPIKNLPLYAELGGGFSFNFFGYDTGTYSITRRSDGYVYYDETIAGNFEAKRFISIGAPYLVIGYKI